MCTQGIGLLLDPVIGTLNQGNILRGIFSHKVKSDENDIHCGSIFIDEFLAHLSTCHDSAAVFICARFQVQVWLQ